MVASPCCAEQISSAATLHSPRVLIAVAVLADVTRKKGWHRRIDTPNAHVAAVLALNPQDLLEMGSLVHASYSLVNSKAILCNLCPSGGPTYHPPRTEAVLRPLHVDVWPTLAPRLSWPLQPVGVTQTTRRRPGTTKEGKAWQPEGVNNCRAKCQYSLHTLLPAMEHYLTNLQPGVDLCSCHSTHILETPTGAVAAPVSNREVSVRTRT